ncbi:MAG: hypothetical protein M3410_18110 [Acidobacteriota bacterium]|nr:hypothetical protein [Acidobacteriota bacterium]
MQKQGMLTNAASKTLGAQGHLRVRHRHSNLTPFGSEESCDDRAAIALTTSRAGETDAQDQVDWPARLIAAVYGAEKRFGKS